MPNISLNILCFMSAHWVRYFTKEITHLTYFVCFIRGFPRKNTRIYQLEGPGAQRQVLNQNFTGCSLTIECDYECGGAAREIAVISVVLTVSWVYWQVINSCLLYSVSWASLLSVGGGGGETAPDRRKSFIRLGRFGSLRVVVGAQTFIFT